MMKQQFRMTRLALLLLLLLLCRLSLAQQQQQPQQATVLNPRPLPVKTKAGQRNRRWLRVNNDINDNNNHYYPQQQHHRMAKEDNDKNDKTSEPTSLPPTFAPTTTPSRSPTRTPTSAPTTAPTMAPTLAPTPRTPKPTFNNNMPTISVPLEPMRILLQANHGDDDWYLYQETTRRTLQDYLEVSFATDANLTNILFVQLEIAAGERRRYRLLQATTNTTTATTTRSFVYTGSAVFEGTVAPVTTTELVDRVGSALRDTPALQSALSDSLPNNVVVVVQADLAHNLPPPVPGDNNTTTDPNEDDPTFNNSNSSSSSGIGGLSWLVFGIVVGGAALALLLIVCLTCYKFKQQSVPPPPPPTAAMKAFSPYNTNGSEDPTETIVEDLETTQFNKSEQPRTLRQNNTDRTQPNSPLYSTPIIQQTDSTDSIEKYSLGSGFYGRKNASSRNRTMVLGGGGPPSRDQPSWMASSKTDPDTSKPPEYTSDTESQFSYDNVGGDSKQQRMLLGQSYDSADSSIYVSNATDDQLTLSLKGGILAQSPTLPKRSSTAQHVYPKASPVATKGYNNTSIDEYSVDLSSIAAGSSSSPNMAKQQKSSGTKGLDDDSSMPFDETIEDSMEQDLDVFAAELEQIKRDIHDSKQLRDDQTQVVSNR